MEGGGEVMSKFYVILSGLLTSFIFIKLINRQKQRLKKQKLPKKEPTAEPTIHIATAETSQSTNNSASDQEDEDDSQNLEKSNTDYTEESQNLLSLLYSIAEDQARKGNFRALY